MRIPTLVLLLTGVFTTQASAQLSVLPPIVLTGPVSPLTFPAPYWPVEIDERHPGPELLVAQRIYDVGWPGRVVLALVVYNHPTKSGWLGIDVRPGICVDHPVDAPFALQSPLARALDLNHDGRTDVVEFNDLLDDTTPIYPVTLSGLQHCRIPHRSEDGS